MDIRADSTDQTVAIAAWTTATGAPVTITSVTTGLSLWYRRGGTGAKTTISPTDLATLATAHADGGLLVIAGAEHRLDLPDAAVAAGAPWVEWGGTATGITIDGGRANLIGQADSATDLSHISGDADAANNAELAFDGTGYAFTGCAIPTISGDVEGKVLGGGEGVITAAGVWALNYEGDPIAADEAIAAILAVTEKLDSGLEADGDVYRCTANFLENSPIGTGGFTTDDRTHLEAIWDKLPTADYLLGTGNESGSGYSTLDAAGVRSAVGMSAADLDAQLDAIAGYVDLEVGAITTHLTDIKGAGWSASTDTLEKLADAAATIAGYVDLEVGAITTHLTDIKGAGWSAATDSLKAISDAVEAIPGAFGTGARTVTITVDDGTDPLENARVRVIQGAEQYVGSTDASGEIVFSLDDATWTVNITKPGYSFTPEALVVNGDETVTYSMTGYSFTPSDPGFVTGYLHVYDEEMEIEAGVDIICTMTEVPEDDTGIAYDSAERTVTSAESTGLCEFTNLVKGATYKFLRGADTSVGTFTQSLVLELTIPDDAVSPYALPSIIGSDAAA